MRRENGLKRVDTYNTFSLDYITQQGILREGYVDWGSADHCLAARRPLHPADRLRAARRRRDLGEGHGAHHPPQRRGQLRRHVRRIGAPRHALDLRRRRDGPLATATARRTTTGSTSSTARSIPTAPSPSPLRARAAVEQLDARCLQAGLTGSKVERLPSYWASKRNDDALVVSLKVSPAKVGLGVRGVREIQVGTDHHVGELVGIPTLGPIEKPVITWARSSKRRSAARIHVGGSITREEITRDDSLIQYLSLNHLYDVSMGKKDRNLIARGFVDVNRLVNVNFFWSTSRIRSRGRAPAGRLPVPRLHRSRARSHWRHRYRPHSLDLLIAAALSASQPRRDRVLFIGNSLTYSNDLPGRVCALARAGGTARPCARAWRSPTTASKIIGTIVTPAVPSPAAGTSSCCSRAHRRCRSRASCSWSMRGVSMWRFGRLARAPRLYGLALSRTPCRLRSRQRVVCDRRNRGRADLILPVGDAGSRHGRSIRRFSLWS
jgi:hypothetical protein